MEATGSGILSAREYEELDAIRLSSKWLKEEDNRLKELVEKYHSDWDVIKLHFPNKTVLQCHQRWKNVLNPGIVKGYWTKEEDDQLVSLVERHGTKKWTLIGSHLKGRIGKQCRERWHNHLDPKLKRTPWTKDEDITIIKAHQLYGNHWSKIAKLLKGRSDNSIKNHWNSVIKKQFEREIICGKKEVDSDMAGSVCVESSREKSPEFLSDVSEENNELTAFSWSPLKSSPSKFLDDFVFYNSHDNSSTINGWKANTPSKNNEELLKSLNTPPHSRTPDGTPLKIRQEFRTPQTPTPFKKILADIEKKRKIKPCFTSAFCRKGSVLEEIQQSTTSYHEKENAKPINSVSRALSFTKSDSLLEKIKSELHSKLNSDSFSQNDTDLCGGDIANVEAMEIDLDYKDSKLEADVEKWATIACGYTTDQLILTDLAYKYLRGDE